MKKPVCIDPEIEGRILLEVGFRVAQGQELSLPADLQQHLAECECCHLAMPTWTEKG